MKKLILGCIAAFIVTCISIAPSSGQQGTKTAMTQFTITNLHSVDTNWISSNMYAMKVTIIGCRSAGDSNTATVYIGPITGKTVYVVAPGTVHTLETQPNTCINLKDWWLRTPTLGDGITVIYQ